MLYKDKAAKQADRVVEKSDNATENANMPMKQIHKVVQRANWGAEKSNKAAEQGEKERLATKVAVKARERQSSMELLRLVLMLLIVALHLNYLGIGLPTQAESQVAPFSTLMRVWAEQVCACAVNAFVLLTGWFGLHRNWGRLWRNVLLRCVVYGLLILLIAYVCGDDRVGYSSLCKTLLPGGEYWFVVCYIGLWLLAPVLNAYVKVANARALWLTVVGLFVFQWLYGWLYDAALLNGGYSIFSFVALYLLARAIRLYPLPFMRKGMAYVGEGDTFTRKDEGVTCKSEAFMRTGDVFTCANGVEMRTGDTFMCEDDGITRRGEGATRETEAFMRADEVITRNNEGITRKKDASVYQDVVSVCHNAASVYKDVASVNKNAASVYHNAAFKHIGVGIYLAVLLISSLLGALIAWALLRNGGGGGVFALYAVKSYLCPLVIVESVAIVLAFARMRFRSGVINWLGGSALAIYLIHAHPIVARPLLIWAHDAYFAHSPALGFAYLAMMCLGICAVCLIIDAILFRFTRISAI